MREAFELVRSAIREFMADRAPRLAAALAYYAVFAIAPLLIILLAVVGAVFDRGSAREQLLGVVREQVGTDTARLIDNLIDNTARSGSSTIASLVGVVLLLVAATGFFGQLQSALNTVWKVRADRKGGGLRRMILTRFTSLGMVLLLGLLLIVSLVAQAALEIVVGNLGDVLPGGQVWWRLGNLVLTLGLFTVVFAAVFKFLPDVELAWRDVWVGALVTALLFKIGEYLIGLYLGTSGINSTYGAAGSLVVLLLWIYYSMQIMLFGAEFTQVYAVSRGHRPEPKEFALPEEGETGRA